ncbi:MAG: hypothetical protein HOC57_13715 [Rhodospirillaceae bacterium]|jgi:hypothetical protein|nr:hypothetical protein [Rhodospirillaceae bacterium]MBT4590345.1 hypothetical protein [Rhodospirillaceae bacterium]
MSKKKLVPTDKYDIGYGKPPEVTQFTKGQSGNPLGRPKGAKNKFSTSRLEKIITDEVYRMIKVNGENGPVHMPLVQGVVRSIGVNAVKGDHRSQKLMLDMTRSVKADDNTDEDDLPVINIHFVKPD